MITRPINIIFDDPPGPQPGRFVEVETDDGASLSVGTWVEREDGLWALRIAALPVYEEPTHQALDDALVAAKRCAYGDSNDDEIEALQGVIDEALALIPGYVRPTTRLDAIDDEET